MREIDLIERQAAIDALKNMCSEDDDGITVSRANVDSMLRVLPSAQPERKVGKWIEQDDSWDGVYYECSCCKEPFTLIDGTPTDNLYNFCPNCGAAMYQEGEQL